ncbi:MAG: glycosyltransferase family 4 protein [Gammaproteobacteria bacterium]|nr:glycosyltransferase family 4 protein [Gammaproteobacteria bacterium]
MKIIYLHQYFTRPDMSGGTRSFEMARRFVAAGHEVDIITSCQAPDRGSRDWRHYTIDGIDVHEFPVPYSNKMRFWRRLSAFVTFATKASFKAGKLGGDVVFATSTPLTIAIPGAWAARKLKVPMVFEVRDLWPELPIAIGALKNPLLKWLAHKLERFAYSNAARVVALSPGMAEGVAATGYPTERIAVIPNSSDIVQFQNPASSATETRDRLGIPRDGALVVYAGTIGEINGVTYLCRVAEAMQAIDPSVHFLIVGDGKDRLLVEVTASGLNLLNKTVHVRDPIAKSEMPDVLAAATVCTSLFVDLEEMWNNSANKFFDGLAAGKPIAINYGGWQADLLRRSGAGIVLDPRHPDKAATRLACFIRDARGLENAATASLDLAKSRFDRDELAESLIQTLADAVAERQAPYAATVTAEAPHLGDHQC